MSRVLVRFHLWLPPVAALLLVGCRGPMPSDVVVPPPLLVSLPTTESHPVPATQAAATPSQRVIQIVAVQNAPETAPTPRQAEAELSVEGLIHEVLARNPSLAQMTAAWQAASARYPQVTSLDDPMFGAYAAPASIGSKDVDFAYRLEVSQKLPFPGKRVLRGQSALAEADAAGSEVDDVRLQLVEAARTTFFDYYLSHRAREVNEEALRLLQRARQIALDRVKANLATQQDVLQAEVEIGGLRERGLTIERLQRVAVARINTLMHLPPDAPLPPPPKQVKVTDELPDAATIRAEAVARRPDLQALGSRIAAEEATLRLALKEYCPDFEVMAAYDAFWQRPEEDLRPQIGVRLNLPVQKSRRNAAVAEAQARIAQRSAQLDRETDAALYEVQQAYEQVRESLQVVRLYEKDILPTSRRNVEAAQTSLAGNRIPFLSLIEAQRNYVGLLDRYHESVADSFRRRAALDRAAGLFPFGELAPPGVNGASLLPCPPAARPGGTSIP